MTRENITLLIFNRKLKKCGECNNEFLPNSNNQCYCTKSCKIKHDIRMYGRPRVREYRVCKNDICNEKFLTYQGNQLFCNEDCKEYFHNHSEAHLNSISKYKGTVKGRKVYLWKAKRERQRHPDRCKARVLAYNHFREDVVCSIPNCSLLSERHHPDYTKPLEVVRLCTYHHQEVHKKENLELLEVLSN